tara:strand:+ start:313 stop:642 length:330 start_codon:yes stop_codon:yes gene_type:complete
MGRFLFPQAASSPVKSVQEVSKTVNYNDTSNSTISAVDLSKTVLTSGSFQNPLIQTANANVRKRAAGNSLGIESDLTSTTNVQFSVTNYFNTLQASRSGTVTLYVLEYN